MCWSDMICRCWFDKSSSGFMSSCTSHVAASGSIIAKINTRDMGIIAAIPFGYKWSSFGTARRQRWCQRSIVWTCIERSVRSLAHRMRSEFSVAIVMENIAGILFITTTSNCFNWTMESSKFGVDSPFTRIPVRTNISRTQNMWANIVQNPEIVHFENISLFFSFSVEEDAQLIPAGMTNDCIAQTWYRFLRTIGSPIALCSPHIVSKTPQFMQWVVSRADGVEAFHHPCLVQLPFIFLKAIKGIASQVDAFLGM